MSDRRQQIVTQCNEAETLHKTAAMKKPQSPLHVKLFYGTF